MIVNRESSGEKKNKKNKIYIFIMVLLNVIFIALLLIGGEIYARFYGDMTTWSEKNEGKYQSPYEEKFPYPWLHLRKANDVTSYGQPEFDFEISTNSEGIRDINHSFSKSDHEFRIVALGDSFTEGQGAPFEQTWCKILEKRMNEKVNGGKVTVIIGGVRGSDPVFEYQLLSRRLLKYDPDLVLMVINGSDFNEIITRGCFNRFDANGNFQNLPSPWIEWLWARSHLFRMVMNRTFGYNFLVMSGKEKNRAVKKSRGCMIETFNKIAELGSNYGFKFLIVGHPFYYQVINPNSTYYLSGFETIAKENNLEYLDVRPFFVKEIGNDKDLIWEYYWPIDNHLTPRGYSLFAEIVEQKIKSMESVEPVLGPIE